MQKWIESKHLYIPYEVPESWFCSLYEDDMDKIVNCASCGKELPFGDCYTSLTIHSAFGMGYCVCAECYWKEWRERQKVEGKRH